MKTIASSEFRKTYGKLTEPVMVLVMGHPIGEWRPYDLSPQLRAENAMLEARAMRPIRPVPKPGRK